MPSDNARDDAERLAGEIVREVCELPDRTSPDDQPDALMVSWQELQTIAAETIRPVLDARDAALRDAREEIETLKYFLAEHKKHHAAEQSQTKQYYDNKWLEYAKALRDARAQEREACAKIADLYAEHPPSGDANNTQAACGVGMDHMAGCMDAATFIAEAIRDPARLAAVPDGGDRAQPEPARQTCGECDYDPDHLYHNCGDNPGTKPEPARREDEA